MPGLVSILCFSVYVWLKAEKIKQKKCQTTRKTTNFLCAFPYAELHSQIAWYEQKTAQTFVFAMAKRKLEN